MTVIGQNHNPEKIPKFALRKQIQPLWTEKHSGFGDRFSRVL